MQIEIGEERIVSRETVIGEAILGMNMKKSPRR